MEILVTGANGFSGRRLVGSLRRTHRVHSLCRTPAGGELEVVHDLREPLDMARLPARIDAVVHTAAIVGREANASSDVHRVNVQATVELAQYAARAGASHFVFFSTGGVYASGTE